MSEELDRVMQALRAADAAGNTEDATKLAAIANKLRSEGSADDNLGMMPFVNKAIASTIEAPARVVAGGAEVIRRGINLIPGVDIPKPELELDWAKKGMRAAGLEIPERDPETIPEHIGRGVGEATSLIIPATRGVQALSKGSGLVGQIASNINKSIIKHPALATISEVTGGAGLGVGTGVGEEKFPDSPAAQQSLGMVGGVIGGMAPTMILHAPTAIALRQGKSILHKISLPFTEKGAKYRAGEYIKGRVTDPTKTATDLTTETMGDLPPVIQAGEKRLTALYKSLIGQDPASDAEIIETLSKSIIKLEKGMRKLGYGSPELLGEITAKRVAALELRMNQRIASSMESAQKRLDALPVAQRKVAESRIVRNELDGVRSQVHEENKALWAEVDKDIRVGTDNTRATYQKFFDELPEAQRTDIPVVLKRHSIIKSEEDTVITTVNELQGLRSKLLEAARRARKLGQWNRARVADDTADAVLADMGIVANTANTPEAKILQTAIAATKNYKTRFENGVVGKILGFDKGGAPAIDPDLTLDISIGRMAQRGSVDIDKIAITPEAQAATKRYLARSFTDYTAKDGAINPVKADRWIKNNEAILDKFPDLQKQVMDISEAQNLANTTRAAMEARMKTLRDPRISSSARFLNAVDMNTTVGSILKSKNPSSMAGEMVRQARKDASGDAVAGLRGGFVEYMLDKAAIGSFNELGEKTLSGRTLLGLINTHDSTLKQVFDPEQIVRMKRVGVELAKIEAFEKAPGGKVDIEMEDLASSALKLFSRVGGAQIGRFVANLTGGGTVQTPGIFSEKFKIFATFLSKDRAFQMIHDAVLAEDASLLKALLLPLDKPGAGGGENVRILGERMNLWLVGTGKRVLEDIQNEIDEFKEMQDKQPPSPENPTDSEIQEDEPWFIKDTAVDEPGVKGKIKDGIRLGMIERMKRP